MNIKRTMIGLAAITALALPASADTLRGTVYQIADGDIYITMEDTTVARVPIETAKFMVNGALVPSNSLAVGQQVVADYTPVYGFQRFYHTSKPADGAKTVYIIQDVRPADISTVEWEGRTYLIEKR